MSERLQVGVVGGGVVGLACARRLQADGHRVQVYDPAPASADGAAWGSAGMIAVDTVTPLATPALLRELPAMLGGGDSPLALPWTRVLPMLPWLLRFAWNARPAAVERAAAALGALCAESLPAWDALVDGQPAASLLRPGGWVTAFETRRAMDRARAEVERRRRHGARAEWLDGPALRARVPQLGDHVVGGVHFEQARACIDPGAFLAALAADVEADGGVFHRVRASGIWPDDDGVEIGIEGGDRVDRCDRIVIATGAWTRALARTLGDDFPLDTERGYHVMLPGRVGPDLPVMSGEHRFVTAAIADGVRLAGTSELGGLERPPEPRRFDMLRRQAARLFPDLDTRDGSEWMGFRPTLPDSLPVVGPSPRAPAVWYAFGHQHLGLTLAAITARLVADGLAGREPPLDPRPLRADRF